MYKINIDGRCASKKNSRIIFARGGRNFNIPSKAYMGFHEDAMQQLWLWKVDNKFKKPIGVPMWFKITFFQKGKLIKGVRTPQDMDNAMSSILDTLEDAGIVENDGLFHVCKGIEIIANCDKFSTFFEFDLL